jgi:hypothetical protein
MISTQNIKSVQAVRPVSLNNASATGIGVDTFGFNYITFYLYVGATAGAISVFKIQQSSDDAVADAYVDLTGATLETLPGAADDGKVYAIHVNLRNRNVERYLKPVLTENNTGTGVYGILAVLGDPSIGPNSAADRGVAAEAFA